MVKDTIAKFLKIEMLSEHKEEFKSEIVEANLLRGKILGSLLILIELIVITFSIIESPELILVSVNKSSQKTLVTP